MVTSRLIAGLLLLAAPWAAQAEESETVTILGVGDMMVGSWGGELIARYGINYPFLKVADLVGAADVATGNLEGPHCTTGEAMAKSYTYRMPPAWLDGIRRAGFDVISVANNHAMDFGPDCFRETVAEVENRGMLVCGGGDTIADGNRPAVIERNGISVAVLGYSTTFPEESWATESTPGSIFPYRDQVIDAVRQASQNHDVVAVHFHWGEQERIDPKEYQVKLAHLVIDHGADVVFGHHAHVLLGIEAYKGKLIFYGLGNFTFASYSETARTAAMARVTLDARGDLVRADVVPLNVYNIVTDLQPVPLPADPTILQELRVKSELIDGGIPAVILADGSIHLSGGDEAAPDQPVRLPLRRCF
jgi:poly-gamma-glutamate synthesis protein (capsule biosynthesis protein)